MNATQAVINHEEVVGLIYEHEKFGKVIVLKSNSYFYKIASLLPFLALSINCATSLTGTSLVTPPQP